MGEMYSAGEVRATVRKAVADAYARGRADAEAEFDSLLHACEVLKSRGLGDDEQAVKHVVKAIRSGIPVAVALRGW